MRFLDDKDRASAAVVLGGIAALVIEVRWEHRVALGDEPGAWVPLAYGALALLAGGPALLLFRRGGRRVLAALFALALLVGVAGFLFHAQGNPLRSVQRVLAALPLPPGKDGGTPIRSGIPPPLAPLAFAGMGALGLLACKPQ
jgi:hypothetical protein